MRITVLFFAQLREIAGRERASVEVPDGSSVHDALEEIVRIHPEIGPMRGQIAVAVDERYQRPTAPLTDGCTLGLIPPVSGG